jgi:hypothetical protein
MIKRTGKPKRVNSRPEIGVLARGIVLASGAGADAGKLVKLTAGTETAAYGILLDPSLRKYAIVERSEGKSNAGGDPEERARASAPKTGSKLRERP